MGSRRIGAAVKAREGDGGRPSLEPTGSLGPGGGQRVDVLRGLGLGPGAMKTWERSQDKG